MADNNMVIMFHYNDVDYGEDFEGDTAIVVINIPGEFKDFIKDFEQCSHYFFDAYEIGNVLDDIEEETDSSSVDYFKENWPNLSYEDARYYANQREGGLDATCIVEVFLEKYPQYKGTKEITGLINIDRTINFNEYTEIEIC